MPKLKNVLKIVAGLAVFLAVAAYFVFQLPAFGGKIEGERLARMQRSPQFIEGKFENTPRQATDNSLLKNLELYSKGQKRKPDFAIPVVALKPETLRVPPVSPLAAAWLGHASVLVEIDGVRVMTDPILSEYASPVPIGPSRLHASPIALNELTGIDAVVISHDHYDHLDMATVQRLGAEGTHFYVGLGIGAHLEKWGIASAQIHEMDWWESLEIKGLKIHCTPARHYSGRKSMDNSTLWASWFLQGSDHSAYYSGDTGYSTHFAAIKERLGAPDLALIKVGAYGETWLDIHMDPEAAVTAHVDLGAKTLLPVHWATFNLSYHAWEEPIVRTLAAARAKGVEVLTPRPGERVDLSRPYTSVAWYEGP